MARRRFSRRAVGPVFRDDLRAVVQAGAEKPDDGHLCCTDDNLTADNLDVADRGRCSLREVGSALAVLCPEPDLEEPVGPDEEPEKLRLSAA